MERFNQGAALHERGRLADAEQIYREVLARAADHVGALHLLGVLMAQTKRLEPGVELMRRALALQPNFAQAHNNCGAILRKLKRFEEALASFDKAIALQPNLVEAHNNRGATLKELKRLDEALASYDKALTLKPDFAETHYNRGNALKELKRLDEAVASYDKALAIRPDHADTLYNRGNALRELKRLDEALASYDKALAITPDDADALTSRGYALMELKRLEEAVASYDKALVIRPDDADTLISRGYALRELKRLEEAVASYDKALAIRPDHVEASSSKSFPLLMAGRFDPGWRLYENRKKIGQWIDYSASRSYPKPPWSGGETLAGKTLFVYWEQGLGDTIQFCRLAKLAEQRGANVVFSVQNRLRRLLQTLSPTIKLIDEKQAPAEFDYHCPLLSLPLAFGTTLNDIPGEAPYLRAEPERVRKWRDKLGCKGFKIGVVWQGSKVGKVDVGRSFAPAEFLGISQIPNVRLISLQKHDVAEQLRELPPGMNIETLGAGYDADDDDAFLDTAAVVETLDLIIGCDTSVPHLAAALGRPVWVVLKYVPDWRWMLDRTDSPWYPTMRLFRQRIRDDWKGVFLEIESALRERMGDEHQAANDRAPGFDAPGADFVGRVD